MNFTTCQGPKVQEMNLQYLTAASNTNWLHISQAPCVKNNLNILDIVPWETSCTFRARKGKTMNLELYTIFCTLIIEIATNCLSKIHFQLIRPMLTATWMIIRDIYHPTSVIIGSIYECTQFEQGSPTNHTLRAENRWPKEHHGHFYIQMDLEELGTL